jgi:hypothetical protein
MAGGRLTNSERDYLMSQGGDLYSKGFSIQSIHDLLKVGTKTLYKWKDEDNWEEKKELNLIRPSEIKNMILQYVVALKNGESLPYKADDLSKIAAAFDRLDDNRKTAVYTMETFGAFSSFMMQKAGTSKGKKREELLQQIKDIRVEFDDYVTQILNDKN